MLKKRNKAKEILAKNKAITNAQRELNKLMKDMPEEEKYHLLMATNQSTVTQAVERMQAQVTLNAYRSAFLYLQETYLKDIVNDELTNEEKLNSIYRMIDFISTEAGKYVIEKEKQKERIKNTELKEEGK